MPRFSVIMPTHGDRPTLPYAVQSVLAQTEPDFELVISGDGAADSTRAIVRELAAADDRIRFNDFPKGEQRGELNRGRSVASSRGKFVAYLPDDDLWMPQHLAVLGEALEDVDLAHTIGISIARDGTAIADVFDAQLFPDAYALRTNSFAIRNCVAGHRRDAYDALPHGWRLSEPYAADTFMWLQFLDAPGTRYRSIKRITALGLPIELRRDMNGAQRAAEIAEWLACISDAARRDELIARVTADMLERDTRRSRRVRERLNVTRLTALAGDATAAAPTFADVDPWRERGRPLPEPMLHAGDRVNFTAFGDHQLYAVAGFSEPESWGCWIDGTRADLVIPLAPDLRDDVVLEIAYRGMIVPAHQPAVPFDVVINGRPCASLTAQTGAVETSIVDLHNAGDWRRARCLAIRIEVHSTVRLCDYGLSPDTRSLGAGLVSIVLLRRP